MTERHSTSKRSPAAATAVKSFLLAVVFILLAAAVHSKTLDVKFDLVTVDPKLLQTPSGELVFSMTVPKDLDPLSAEEMRDAATKPMQKQKELINEEIRKTGTNAEKYQEDIKKAAAKGDTDGAQDLQKQLEAEVALLNDFYASHSRQATADAAEAANGVWENIKKKSKTYSTFKYKAAFKLTKGVFSLVGSIKSLVLSAGTFPPGWIGLVNGIRTMAIELKATFESLGTAVQDMGDRVKEVQDAASKSADGSVSISLRGYETALKNLRNKSAQADVQARKLAGKLENALDKSEKITNADKKQKSETDIQAMIDKIQSSFQTVKSSERMVEDAENLLEIAKKNQTKLGKAKELGGKILDLSPTLISAAFQMDELVEKATNVCSIVTGSKP